MSDNSRIMEDSSIEGDLEYGGLAQEVSEWKEYLVPIIENILMISWQRM